MYVYLCLYLSIYRYIYLYIYVCAWCRQRRCRGVHTRLTPANISVYIGVYIGMPAAVSGGVEECALNTRLLIWYIGICRCMYRCLLPSAADIGVHTAHRPPSSIYRYIGIYRYVYRYTKAAVSGGAYECTLHTSLLPLPVIYTDIYADVYADIYTAHRPPSSHIPICICIYIYIWVYIYLYVWVHISSLSMSVYRWFFSCLFPA